MLNLVNRLFEQRKIRKQAAHIVAEFHNIQPECLIYMYLKQEIPYFVHIDENTYYAFHGRECSVKTQEWKVDIEFGIRGCYTAFSKGTIALINDTPYEEANNLIDLLLENNIIQFIDQDFLFLSEKINQIENSEQLLSELSFEEQVDLSVADRYVLVE